MSTGSAPKNIKSYSLPKLQENGTSSSSPQRSKRPLQSFHKVNWSIAPRCLVEGHEAHPVIYVCVHKECAGLSRLVCQQCFYFNHSTHNKNFLAVDEIKTSKIHGLRYWPFDREYKPMFDFIKSHNSYIENLIQDIKSAYDVHLCYQSIQNSLQSLTQAILMAKEKYVEQVQKFYIKETKKQEYVNELTSAIQKCLNFKQIQTCVRQVFNKEIRHDIFMKKMNTILNDSSHLGKLEQVKRQFEDSAIHKGKDMHFDIVYFMKKQKMITKSITDLQASVTESDVVIDEAAIGLESIIVQTVQYLKKTSSGLCPLTFEEKHLEDGTYYNGFLSKGTRCLLGFRDYRNGFVYSGEWKNDCKNGWGVYENKEKGYKYSGYWKQDKRNGYGKETTTTYSYEGNFVNDRKQGFGSIIQDGVRLDITWKNDRKNGTGKRLDLNGQTQVYFLNGVESLMKGGSNVATSSGEGQKRDVNYFAKMFSNGQ